MATAAVVVVVEIAVVVQAETSIGKTGNPYRIIKASRPNLEAFDFRAIVYHFQVQPDRFIYCYNFGSNLFRY